MRSRLNSSEGIRLCAVDPGEDIVIDRTRKVDGLLDDALLHELCLQGSQSPEIELAEPGAKGPQGTPLPSMKREIIALLGLPSMEPAMGGTARS